MKTRLLLAAECQRELRELPGWTIENDAIVKHFQFADFRSAMAFMIRASYDAEELAHHPDWSNNYDRVTIRIRHHDLGGISTLCFELARRINSAQ